MTADVPVSGPRVEVRPGAIRALGPGHWDITWGIRGQEPEPLLVREAWLPHGRFRAPRRSYNPPERIDPGEVLELMFDVAVDESSDEVENAFVILSVDWHGEAWRIFARVRVGFRADGTPDPVTESYSVQRIGSAG